MRCEYCLSREQSGEVCNRCGAPIVGKTIGKPLIESSAPFFYNGYICYSIRDHFRDTYEVQFWLGLELQERIEIPRELYRERVAEDEDGMILFWDLFLLQRGETEVLKYTEKNKKYPAVFEIRRIENPQKEKIRSMSLVELSSVLEDR